MPTVIPVTSFHHANIRRTVLSNSVVATAKMPGAVIVLIVIYRW